MQYVFTVVTSVVAAMLVFILQSVIKENSKLKKEKEEAVQKKEQAEADKQTALEDGVVCLLRVKLIEYHTKYMRQDTISSHGFQNWMLMYKAYKGLGGNGMIEHMKDEIEELHIE